MLPVQTTCGIFHGLGLIPGQGTLAWRIPGTREPGGLPSYGVAKSQTRLKRLSSSQHWWASCYYRKFPQGGSTSSCPTLVPPATKALGKVHLLCECAKAMAPHSSTLAWKIPWMEEPSRLQSMGSLRVGHD